MTRHLLSFDIEEWFQVPFAEGYVDADRSAYLPTVEEGTKRILSLLARYDTKATFFVVGRIAEQYPALVRDIARQGHEIGCHGHEHITVDRQTPEQFRADLRRSIAAIRAACGESPRGYRAPLASIGERNRWALREIRDAGFAYDSSVYPANPFVHSGLRDALPDPYEIEPGLTEIPLTVARVLWFPVPISGGFYLRCLPPAVFHRLFEGQAAAGRRVVLYYHSWEFATAYPRVIRHPVKRFVQYHNLDKVAPRLEVLLGRYRFAPLRDVLR